MPNPLLSPWLHNHHRRRILLIILFVSASICFTWLYLSQYSSEKFGLNSGELDLVIVVENTKSPSSSSHIKNIAAPTIRGTVLQENLGKNEQMDRKLISRFAQLPRRNQQRVVGQPKNKSSALISASYLLNETAAKRRFIRQMMKHAWDGYARYAWSYSRVAPHSKRPSSVGVFGDDTQLGITIVDSLDTLWIMGLRDEYEHGRQWVVQNLSFADVDHDISIFETNIRVLGGLLSAFALSGDVVLLQKAYELGRLMLPAFDTPTGIPWALYNFKTKTGKYWLWTPGGGPILSEFGSLHLEFAFLSNATGDPIFLNKVLHIRNHLDRLQKPKNLYSNYLNSNTGEFELQWFTAVGSMGDSFYEYLLKVWLWSNRTDSTAKRMYDEAITGIENELVKTSDDGHVYFVQMKGRNHTVDEMDHLACFMGGLYALSAAYADTPNKSRHFASRGAQIADTCHATYAMTKTGLGPDIFRFEHKGRGGSEIKITDGAFYLRPELVETYFVLWRRTRDPKYRRWGWEVAQAIEKYCRAEAGYAGLRDVSVVSDPATQNQDDVQDSYFLAETLKYLYLLFVDDKPVEGTSTAEEDGGVDISLEEFVFNTEAHPLPIFGGEHFPSSIISTTRFSNNYKSTIAAQNLSIAA